MYIIAFNTYSTNCPTKSKIGAFNDATYNGSGVGSGDGFITIFDNNGVQKWASYFGSSDGDDIGGIAVGLDKFFIHGDSGGHLVGNTPCDVPTNGGFPLCDFAGSSDYFDNHTTNDPGFIVGKGFITEFDDSYSMVWSTFFGGNIDAGSDGASTFPNSGGISVYQTETELTIYVTGAILGTQSNTSGCSAVTGSNQIPLCGRPNNVNVAPPSGSIASLYIARFGINRDLQWSTFYSGGGTRLAGIRVNVNDNGIFVAGNAAFGGFTALGNPNLYNQSLQKGQQDPALIAYDFTTLQPIWATTYGGTDNQNFPIEEANDFISVNNQLYLVGRGFSLDFPFNCDKNINFCRDDTDYLGSYLLSDGFITRFDLVNLYNNTNKIDKSNNIHIFPNPTTDKININIEENNLKEGQITVYNLLGQIVQSINNQNLQNDFSIDVSHLKQGVYFLVIETNSQYYSQKFIKN